MVAVYPIPRRLEGLGECRKLPQWGLSGAKHQLQTTFRRFIRNLCDAILRVFSAFWKLALRDNNTKIQQNITGLIKSRCMLALLYKE